MFVFIYSYAGGVFNYDGLTQAVEKVAELVKEADAMVVKSGCLKGISLDQIRQAGQRLNLHKHCREFFQKIVKLRNGEIGGVHVISYCWSGELIRSALSTGIYAFANIYLGIIWE